jgi:CDP-diacylglycerol--glycerol-3-phosphate 3-phosphatidyltransferase
LASFQRKQAHSLTILPDRNAASTEILPCPSSSSPYLSMSLTRAAIAALEACPRATPGPSRLPAIVRPNAHWRAARRLRYHPLISTARHARWNSTAAAVEAAGQVASPPPPGIPIHKEPAFESLSTALSASQPCFGARGDEITLYSSPGEFKKALLEMIKRARRRILISTLYIGASQAELVSCPP